VLVVRPLYGTSDHLLASGLAGLEAEFVDAAGRSPNAAAPTLAWSSSRRRPTRPWIWSTSPPWCAGRRGAGAGRFHLRHAGAAEPAALGAAYVLHSATKFLGGHGDVDRRLHRLRRAAARPLRQVRAATGALLHPLACLPAASRPADAGAARRARAGQRHRAGRRLQAHPAVARIHFPGELITPAVSLGSTDTLIQPPAALTHRIVDEAARAATGIAPTLLRLSVGLEGVEDLWADLQRGLGAA
jgi:methionine-gamma-lyase